MLAYIKGNYKKKDNKFRILYRIMLFFEDNFDSHRKMALYTRFIRKIRILLATLNFII